ncbi:MAG: phosphatase PAP2 family protein [Myxococcota bacterium]
MMRDFFAEVRAICAAALANLVAWRWRLLAGLAVFAVLACFTVPRDAAWVESVRAADAPFWVDLADLFSVWGDYPRGPLIGVALLFATGVAFKRPQLRRVAIACFLAASLAGVCALSLRSLVGRPRPRSPLPDGLYGPTLDHTLHSFPSGHTASAFGTACALLPTIPVIGIPGLVFAGGVAWSRMHRNYHHLTDVAGGAGLGVVFGLAFGVAVRRRGKLPLASD